MKRQNGEKFRKECQEVLALAPFCHRETISHSAIEKLLDCGIDAPERLLFMTEEAIKSIPGLNEVSWPEFASIGRNSFEVGTAWESGLHDRVA